MSDLLAIFQRVLMGYWPRSYEGRLTHAGMMKQCRAPWANHPQHKGE